MIKEDMDTQFHNPTRGEMSFDEVIYDLVDYMESDPDREYELIVGSDSSGTSEEPSFVSVIVVHKVGRGARYFWTREIDHENNYPLRQRIYREASLSLELAENLIDKFKKALSLQKLEYDFQIHVDIGREGPTKELIQEVVGMIESNGFEAYIKPEAYGASTVADKHVK